MSPAPKIEGFRLRTESEVQKTNRRNLLIQGGVLVASVMFLLFTIIYAMWTIDGIQSKTMDAQRAVRIDKMTKLEHNHFVLVERELMQIKNKLGITLP